MNGRELQDQRKRRSLTQVEVARRLGLTQGRIAAIENSVRVTDRTTAAYLAALDGPEPEGETADRLEQITAQFLAELETLDPADGETVP